MVVVTVIVAVAVVVLAFGVLALAVSRFCTVSPRGQPATALWVSLFWGPNIRKHTMILIV